MSDLAALQLEDVALRSRLNALVHERTAALEEAQRLRVRAQRPGGEPALADEAGRWEIVAERVAGDIEQQRARLRENEAALAAARRPA